jgi:signal peptidase I
LFLKKQALTVIEANEGISFSATVVMELIEAVHEKGAAFRFQARGHSMLPAVRDGDIITISPLNGLMPRRGDVLAFRYPESQCMLVHRVLYTKRQKYYMKGDNCPDGDGWIANKNVLGLITKVERVGRVRFWPNRLEPNPGSAAFLFLYPCWPPVRRVLVRRWRNMRRLIWTEKK